MLTSFSTFSGLPLAYHLPDGRLVSNVMYWTVTYWRPALANEKVKIHLLFLHKNHYKTPKDTNIYVNFMSRVLYSDIYWLYFNSFNLIALCNGPKLRLCKLGLLIFLVITNKRNWLFVLYCIYLYLTVVLYFMELE